MQQRVIILGGGLVGTISAISLAQQGLSVTVVDHSTTAGFLSPEADGRTTAISYGSKLIFEKLGLWELCRHKTSPILKICIFEDGSPWHVTYDAKTVADHPMAFIIRNFDLRQAIWECLQEQANVTWIAAAEVKTLHRNSYQASAFLQDDSRLEAELIIGAEGRNSPSRAHASIPLRSWTYSEQALTTIIHHEQPHAGRAFEIFTAQGPLAILPLPPCPLTNSPRSGVVLVGPPAMIEGFVSQQPSILAGFLQEKFTLYGELKCLDRMWRFPLSAMRVSRLIDQRLVLVGDAAHVVHPVAGQGVNLGWRDAAALADILGEARRLGLDIGATEILNNYQRKRQPDHNQMLYFTDGIVRIFNHQSLLLYFLRNAGLALINELPPLKNLLMRKAMGI